MSAVTAAYTVLPRPLLAALHSVLLAVVSVLAAFRWWHGEPAVLRVFLCACWGWWAVVLLVLAAWLHTRKAGAS